MLIAFNKIWSGAAKDRNWLSSIRISNENKSKLVWDSRGQNLIISVQLSSENKRKLVWDSPGQNLIDFYSNFNCKWNNIGLAQPRIESDWFLFKFQLKITGNWCGAAKRNSIEFLYFYWNWKELVLKERETASDWFQFRLQFKMKGNWSGTAHDWIWLISIQILIENERKLVWDSPGQNLHDFYLNFNWK